MPFGNDELYERRIKEKDIRIKELKGQLRQMETVWIVFTIDYDISTEPQITRVLSDEDKAKEEVEYILKFEPDNETWYDQYLVE